MYLLVTAAQKLVQTSKKFMIDDLLSWKEKNEPDSPLNNIG